MVRVGSLLAVPALMGSVVVSTSANTLATKKTTAEAKTHMMRILNDPSQKIGARMKMLKELREKLNAMAEQKLLSDQKPKLDEVMKKIDVALALKDPTQDAIESVVKEVQKGVDDLKSGLMRRAMELADEQHKRIQEELKQQEGAETGFMRKRTAEDAFDKLMEIQDAPLKEQMSVLKEFEKDDFVREFLKGDFKEGDNLAMKLGEALDNRKQIEAQAKQEKDVKVLADGAHLNEEQAKTLLPILSKVREQQKEKKYKLAELNRQLSTLEDQERVFKKRKALLSKETGVLGEAIQAIEAGEIDKLTAAMDKLKELSV